MTLLAAAVLSIAGLEAHDPSRSERPDSVMRLSPSCFVSRVTGKPLGVETFPSPNDTPRDWQLGGTDLGIMWDMEDGRVGIIFGDSYGAEAVPRAGGPNETFNDWRSNVLAFSSDTNLADGLTLDGMAPSENEPGRAREIMFSAKTGPDHDYTTIPSGALHVNGKDYIHYWNLKNWDGWRINYASFYCSEDHGVTWHACPEVIFGADSHFGMVSMAKKDGYVYMMGCRAGRQDLP